MGLRPSFSQLILREQMGPIAQGELAAPPQHMAERLRLSGLTSLIILRLRLRIGGAASPKKE